MKKSDKMRKLLESLKSKKVEEVIEEVIKVEEVVEEVVEIKEKSIRKKKSKKK